jgi:hypothetical protein
MKKILLSSLLIFSALLVMQTICRAQTVQTVPLYRLRFEGNSSGGGTQSEHFYTANKAERDSVLKNLNYGTYDFDGGGGFSSISFLDEGIEGYLSPTQVPGTVPLYRLYKEPMKHFYTADAKEKSRAISKYGYRFENIVGYVSAVQIPGTTPLYRAYRATVGKTGDDHFYTIKEDEKFGALHKYGYVDDGITCYVWTSAVKLSTGPPIRIPK